MLRKVERFVAHYLLRGVKVHNVFDQFFKAPMVQGPLVTTVGISLMLAADQINDAISGGAVTCDVYAVSNSVQSNSHYICMFSN
jgi:hypothetical protein